MRKSLPSDLKSEKRPNNIKSIVYKQTLTIFESSKNSKSIQKKYHIKRERERERETEKERYREKVMEVKKVSLRKNNDSNG